MHEFDDHDSITLCQSCDLAVRKRALPSSARALCPRCHTALYDSPYCSINGMLALCIAALVIFIPANLLPVLEIHFLGSVRTTTVMHAAVTVWSEGYWVVGLAVMVAAVIAPGLLILSILTQVVVVKLKLHSSFWQRAYTTLLKNHGLISQMTMLEIYVISFLVSAFQLSDFSDVYFGMGTFCFTMLFIIILFLQREYNLEHMWGYVDD
ncbi:MAG: paraquat-inducible protein A [Shewanella psychromarinicola]|jgi:paraquat-inducible protein A|uniref:Paraquat-inducible protein A n=1 Tax=Shewanella psychromarinicola TaxID=2487742 RepID=A0A3N4EBX4_9GAMM|nr:MULTISPECIES: paraquat-inducible protein A [Shewanella]AZG36021.1 paraquat-inducible protein A [Shewanella psychromarinicola]MCL1080389.1 paraquat-inducible protein A [Shewanella psychromarinicola]PKG77320.1 paraquat-inducible protein A [Shewanella sp. Actino-trap-3]RPA31710.1 paraquat-inducible protein A [Shewanella psychromarinicola]|tara:strand:- start:49225 stop:49851 length:627 start_codon:yes stop_codon:yes gene_type:complete